MTETATRKVIELHFHHKFGSERLPFHGMFGTPSAWASWGFTSKARRLNHRLKLFSQRDTIFIMNRRRIANVIEQSSIVVKTEK